MDFKNPVYSEKNARASLVFDTVVCWGERERERERKRRETRKKMRGRKKK